MRILSSLLSLLALASPITAAVYQGHAVLHELYNSTTANTATPLTGSAVFSQNDTLTTVSITVGGLAAGKRYGVHIHQYGDFSAVYNLTTKMPITPVAGTISSVGGHFDYMGRSTAFHGCRGVNDTRHTGDLGEIVVDSSTLPTENVTYTLYSELLDLGFNNILNDSIIGRTIVVHELADPCYQVGTFLGNWVAVGVIGIENVAENLASQEPLLPSSIKANALIFQPGNTPVGNLVFSTDANQVVRIRGFVDGFEANSTHGLHIHMFGNEASPTSLGGHYFVGSNNSVHGLPPTATRHFGDLGNVTADANGVINFYDTEFYNTDLVSLYNKEGHSIIGRAITFHQFLDDGTTTSYGDRVAYGVIGLAAPDQAPTTPAPTTPAPTTPAPTTPAPTTPAPTTTAPTTPVPTSTPGPATNSSGTTAVPTTTPGPATNSSGTTAAPTMGPTSSSGTTSAPTDNSTTDAPTNPPNGARGTSVSAVFVAASLVIVAALL